MTEEFKFNLDTEGREFCFEIISEMIRLFGISKEEALGRINRLWVGVDFLGQDDLRYHEDEEFWAKDIYYGHGSYWWNDPEDLAPLPYP